MGRTLEEVLDALPARERRVVEARALELRAEEMTLRELRKALGKTQTQLARRLGKPQAAVSRMETQADMLISTLGEVVEGLGGRLSLHAELPGHAPVEIAGFGALRGARKVAAPAMIQKKPTARR